MRNGLWHKSYFSSRLYFFCHASWQLFIVFWISFLNWIHIYLKILLSSTKMIHLIVHSSRFILNVIMLLVHLILVKIIQIILIISSIITYFDFFLVFNRWMSNFIVQSLNFLNVNIISCWFDILSFIKWLFSAFWAIFWWDWWFSFKVLWFFSSFGF